MVRWYLADLETAQHKADEGDLTNAGRLCVAMRRDGTISGLLGALTSGLVRLPRRFYGDEALCAELQKNNGTRSVFDAMHPPAELALLAGDGRLLGVGVGEYLPVQDREYPVFCRLDPENLQYRWIDNTWYYRSRVGLLPITPGDGRWVLHLPGGRLNPWRSGIWPALGKAYINKDHASLHRANYVSKLANPARAATAPHGASTDERNGFLSRIIAWSLNTVFELPPGWDVKLIESNGQGWQVFDSEIKAQDNEIMIALAGQIVTTTGGTGFTNADVFQLIRSDFIQDLGDSLSHTLNTQGLPLYTFLRKGVSGLENGVSVEYITKRQKDLEAEARTMQNVAVGVTAMRSALAPDKLAPETRELMTRYDVPTRDLTPEEQEAFARAMNPENDKGTNDQPARNAA